MTEATQLASKKIIGAPIKLYKLDEVQDGDILTTSFGKASSVFVQVIEASTPVYVSTTIDGGVITFELSSNDVDLDVMVWGE